MNSHPPTPPARGALSRRSLVRGGLAAGGLGLVAGTSGCGSALSAGLVGSELAPGTTQFWNLFGGGDGARMIQMEDEYRKQQGSEKSLEAATFAWGNPYYSKVTLATLGNKPPDVAVSHATRAANLAEAGLLSPITDEVLAAGGLTADSFTEKAWESVKVDGVPYALPLDTHPWVVFYNTEVLDKAGLVDSDGKLKPIEGTDGWEAAMTAAKEASGQWGMTTGSVGDNSNCWRMVNTLYFQTTGAPEFLSDQGTRLSYDEGILHDVLVLIRSWAEKGLMPSNADTAGAESSMFTGKSGFFLNGEWEVTTAQGIEGLTFGMAAFPTLYDEPAAHADSHTFILPKMDRDEDRLKRAMGFVKSMLDQSMTWAAGGHIPAYAETFNSSEYENLEPMHDYAEAANYAKYDSPAWYSGSGSNFENVIGSEIGLVIQGLSKPEAALASIKSQLGSYAKTANPL
ncbi:extracellular solute-binding protein [Kineococcus sp. NBC_00420]|uniref:extracellular solute-binding protein n=1 Tax=unclassified Kineococcus TaxID=2621656 RepID=UPI002E23C70E